MVRVLPALLCALGASAESRIDLKTPVEITAQNLEYIERGQVYVAEGGVQIRQGKRQLRADWMAISLATRRGIASGQVELRDRDQLAFADFMQFDLDDLTGVLFEADIDTGDDGIQITGAMLLRRSEVDYSVSEGRFTSCRCPDPEDRKPWVIETKEAEVEVGGYGRAKSSTIEVLEVPVAWIPWLAFPVKTERETGLLLPDLAFGGRSGFELGVPFFWAARHDVGVIATPTYDKNRGFRGDLEVEYLLGERSEGVVAGSYVRDDSVVPGSGVGRNRWAFFVEHDQSLPAGWRGRIDAKGISDNAFLDDFDEYALYRRDLFLLSEAFAFRNFGETGRVGFVGALRHADDLQNPVGLDRDSTLLNRLPDLQLRALPGRTPGFAALGLVPSLDANYIYFFQREDPESVDPTAPLGPDRTFLDAGIAPALGAADPTRGDGLFEPGEPLLEHGSRLVLHPRVARPVAFGRYATFVPEVGYAQTLSDGSRGGFGERGVYEAQGDLRTALRASRRVGEARALTHRLEPFVNYTFVRTRAQASTPVFVPGSPIPQNRLRQLAPENYVLDPSDRIPNANLLAVGVDNAFRLSRPGGGRDPLRANLWASFQHDFDQAGAGTLVLGGVGRFGPRLEGRGSLAWDAGQNVITEGLVGARVGLPSSSLLRVPYFAVSYRFLRVPPRIASLTQPEVNQIDLGVGFRLAERLLVDYGIAYSLDDGSRIAQAGTVIYASRCRCFTIGFDVVEDRTRDVFFRVRYSITGLGDRSGDPFAAARGLFSSLGP